MGAHVAGAGVGGVTLDCGTVLLAALALQALLVAAFAVQLQRRRRERRRWPPEPPGGWPRAEVVLCLRGADASLPAVLAALAAQRYPGAWRLQVVVDASADPAWPVLERFRARAPRLSLQLQALEQRPPAGSLKCAALRQAFAALHPDAAVVALVDADAVVGPTWLADLALACLRPGVGGVSGNRWYQPSGGSLAGHTRAVWNAGALVLMTLLAIPWGGSLAVRREVVEAGAWTRLLEHGLCEDTGLLAPLRALALRFEFRPELLVIDHDDTISLPPLRRWITRQLLTARLHHPAWPLVALHGIGSALLLAGAALQGAWRAVGLYELGCIALLLAIEATALERPPRQLGGWLRALLPGQLIDGWATLAAALARQVEWRGVHYRLTRHPKGVVAEAFSPSASVAAGSPSTPAGSRR